MTDPKQASFEHQLGVLLMARRAELPEGQTEIDISDLNIEKLQQFFDWGWDWGEMYHEQKGTEPEPT